MICRICSSQNLTVFCDLGIAPLANRLITDLDEPETYYPLRPMLCEDCLLVQLPSIVTPAETFTDYPYFSSQSQTFVDHAMQFVADVEYRFSPELVVEIASNDGYLLQHFHDARCYGVEPARNVAEHAIKQGVPTLIEFFDNNLVCDKLLPDKADLIVANNVLAHVPNIHGFLQGVSLLLAPEGVFTIEVPWLKELVDREQVGQIYHEHLSYFLLCTLEKVLGQSAIPLRIFDVEHLDVHGGSLRIYACHNGASHEMTSPCFHFNEEESHWLQGDPLHGFANRPPWMKHSLWEFLCHGRKVVGYGAAAKAATVLSYCGIGPETVPYIVDTTPAKQGRYMNRIPIVSPDRLQEDQPPVIWIMPWNLSGEIIPKLREQCHWTPTLMWQDGTQLRFLHD